MTGLLAAVTIVALSVRVDPDLGQPRPGELLPQMTPEEQHDLIAEVLRAPAPDGTHYPAGTTGLMLSEVVASNGSTLVDEDGDASDWIELHNPTDTPIDVGGFYLADDDAEPQRFELPSRVIEPGGYLIVFASGKGRAPELAAPASAAAGATPVAADLSAVAADLTEDDDDLDVDDDPSDARLLREQLPGGPGDRIPAAGQPGEQVHTDFALSQDGEPILLIEPDGRVVADRLPPIPLPRDAALGRHPDDSSTTCLFDHGTPGAPNPGRCWEDLRLGAPTLSAATGVHTGPLEVSVDPVLPAAVSGADREPSPLYYTLDGSYPDPDANPDATQTHDPASDGPLDLSISDRSGEAAPLSAVWTGLEQRFPQRAEPQVELQGTPVRVRPADGRERVATYLVGEGFRALELPVVALVADPGHLMDEETGLFVPGRRYEEYRASPEFDPDHGFRIPANPVQRGRLWERPLLTEPLNAVRFEYCTRPDTTPCELSQDVGLRVHGNFSRLLPQKNLRLYARNHYGDDHLEHAFFGDAGPDRHRRLILRVSGNDWGLTMLWDAYLQTVIREMEFDTQADQPTVVFINGEYWGVQNLRERYDRHYLGITHDVDSDEVVMLARAGNVDEGLPQDGQDYLDLIDAVAAAPLGDPEIVARVEREVDIEGLFDTVIARTVVADTDWPHANVRTWRVRTEPTGSAEDRGWPDSLAEPAPTDRPGGPAWGADDGRWRWMNFDLDHAGDGFGQGGEGHATALTKDEAVDALGRFLDADEHPEWAQDIRLLTETLLAVPAYREAFVARYHHHLDTTFAPERTVALLEERAGAIAGEMQRHSGRWGYPDSAEAWRDHVEEVRRFMVERPEHARRHLEQHLGD